MKLCGKYILSLVLALFVHIITQKHIHTYTHARSRIHALTYPLKVTVQILK